VSEASSAHAAGTADPTAASPRSDIGADPAADPVARYLTAHAADVVDHLAGWVRLRSVAGMPEHVPDLVRSANWLAGELRSLGFPTVEVWSAGGIPAVYGAWCAAADAPTVLVYSHHDVRAAKDELWEQCPPFQSAFRDGRLYGRGSSDAKGQVLAHLWGLRAHLALTGGQAPQVNIKVLVEGEEETGSPHLAGLLEAHCERWADVDLVMLSDTMLWSADHPAVCHGSRGTMQASLEVYGPRRDIHSGAVAGAVVNPAHELCRLIGRLHDEEGRVTVPGFYDAVVDVPEDERRAIRALPHSDEDWRQRAHTRAVVGERGYSIPERLYLRPSAEVLALAAGDPVGPSRGAIPSMATASLTIRTVPDQRAAEIAALLRSWVAEEIADAVDYRLTVSEETAQEPYITPSDLPALAVLHDAMSAGWGRAAGRMRNAGGAPASLLVEATGAPLVFFGTGLPEDNWHDSDESVRLDVLLAGAATLAHFWGGLARTGRAG
jgi:acetylornithine deacetylase/succinyl-diaminopimelate desuccinylase-like protein